MQPVQLKTARFNLLGTLFLLLVGCLSWGQTQSADKPEANAKPSPSPSSSPAVVTPSGVGAGNMGVPYRDLEAGNTPDLDRGIEILSDTTGVDFGPYMKNMRAAVYERWLRLMPASARPPIMKRGRVVIEFAIMRDGSIQGMRLVRGAGDVALDRAAWGAITSSAPLPSLPIAFTNPYLRLRTSFQYNPDPADAAKPPTQTPSPQPAKQDPKN